MKFVDFVKNSISSICAKYLNDDEEIENKLMYSILHTSIMTQTEYETVKQSLTNSLTYK